MSAVARRNRVAPRTESWAGRLPKPQSDELELLKELPDFRDATSRLSCQVDFTEALSGLKVAIAPDS